MKFKIALIILLLYSLNIFAVNHKLTVIFTSDEHGWVEPDSINGGLPNLYEIIKKNYFESENFLLLSGGDNFAAGPQFTMETKGETTMELFRVLGYFASPVGNHDFDFGVPKLIENQKLSNMNYLAANIIDEKTGNIADFAMPYIIKDFKKIKVGIIGLANFETPLLTNPINLKGLKVISYDEALLKFLPVVKQKSDIIIVLVHDCSDFLQKNESFKKLVNDFGVAFVGSGHCHQIYNEKLGNTNLIETGSYLRNYSLIDIFYDDINKSIKTNSKIVQNTKHFKKNENVIDYIIAKYNNELKSELEKNQVIIGKLERDFDRKQDDYYLFICKTWFEEFPEANFAFINRGSVRQDLKKGDITLNHIKTIMPFDNKLLIVEILGKDLINEISNKKILSFLKTNNKIELSNNDSMIEPNKIYKVVLPDFLYNGGDKVTLNKKSKNVVDININYHQPVINYFQKYKIIK